MAHTTCGSEKTDGGKHPRARCIWAWAWAGTVAMDRSMCALRPPETLCPGAPTACTQRVRGVQRSHGHARPDEPEHSKPICILGSLCLTESSNAVRPISPAVHCSPGPTRNPLPETLLPLTRPSTSAWLSDERGNVGRTRQGGSCGRTRTRTCARGRAGRSRRPPCGGDTCHGGDPNLCSTSAAACCADACNGHRKRADACRPAGPGPPTGTPGHGSCCHWSAGAACHR